MVLIYPGDDNDLVRQVKQALNGFFCYRFNEGHRADDLFLVAVKDFQSKHGLTADGIVGNQTLKALRLTYEHPAHSVKDFEEAAKALKVDVASICAFAEVESAGSGFLPDGRPKILFERHQFYKRMIVPRKPGETQAALMAKRSTFALKYPEICSPTPGGYKGGVDEWDRLTLARSFSDTAAIESASFGLFQVMGFNASKAFWPDVQSFFRCMHGSEGDQVKALTGFLMDNPSLTRSIVQKDWKAVAYGYNGPGYATNRYDIKLTNAYVKYKAIYG